MTTRHTLALGGCRSTPLAHYLKALAILRLVAEQADADARGAWKDGQFELTSRLDADALRAFFLEEYRPSPIVAPWNGGSGFGPKDNTKAIDAIAASDTERLALYRQTIDIARMLRERLGIGEKVSAGDEKAGLLDACRAEFPDGALDWFDAAVVLLDGGPQYPPLLGTGGNDGRLDFTNNFMQRLGDVIDPAAGQATPPAAAWLEGALFGESVDALGKQSIGQFFPGAAGGANAGAGFDSSPLINPWDFVLMIEGALFFASASSRRLETTTGGALSAPFTVRPSGVGYGSASGADSGQSRGELWLPLWSEPTSYRELRALFSEGRASVGRTAARNGVEFARAVAMLGVDRGIDAFERIGLHERNGLAYFAVPLGQVAVRRQPQVDLLEAIDPWLDRFLSSARGKNTPARVASAARQLEEAIFALTRRRSIDTFQNVLLALGQAHAALAASHAWTKEQHGLRPLRLDDPAWVTEAFDHTPEFRLATALAGLYAHDGDGKRVRRMREHLEPVVREGRRWKWADNPGRDVVWSAARPLESMIAVLKRRLIATGQSSATCWPDRSSCPAHLDDVAAFVEGRVDEQRLGALIEALVLVENIPALAAPASTWRPDAVYGLMKLCFAGHAVEGVEIPINTAIVHRALAGSAHALEDAARRLRASGLPPAVRVVHAGSTPLLRAAAALLFPIAPESIRTLARINLRPQPELTQ